MMDPDDNMKMALGIFDNLYITHIKFPFPVCIFLEYVLN